MRRNARNYNRVDDEAAPTNVPRACCRRCAAPFGSRAWCTWLWMPALAVARDADPVADHPAPDRCNIQAAPDPRLEVLLQADAADEQINVTSDTGEMGRNGDAS
jgi:hypothetical protein